VNADVETWTVVRLGALAFGSFVLALSGALVPGPMFSAVLAGSHRHGFWFGPGVVLGHALAEMPVVALLLVGLASVLNRPTVLAAIGGVGAAMLVWMGVGLARQAFRAPPASGPDPGGAGARSLVGGAAGDAALIRFGAVPAGFLTSVLNPYWHLWWVTQPALLLASAARMGWLGVGAFFVGHIAADLLWYSLTALGVSRGRRLLEGRGYKVLLVVCAAILFVMAGLFVKLVIEGWHP
jgi:threonine/homoserine/homoserine lactone efflux protein